MSEGLVLPRKTTMKDLVLPTTLRDAERAADHLLWIQQATEMLSAAHIPWSLNQEEMGIAVRRHHKGQSAQWLVFDAVETAALLPPEVWFQQVAQWNNGTFTPDNVYRILSPAEQIRISNRVGLKPLAEVRQDTLSKEVQLRDSMRKQGFDPDLEKP